MHKRSMEYTSTLAGVVHVLHVYIVQLNLKDERQFGAPNVVTSPKGSSGVRPGKQCLLTIKNHPYVFACVTCT